MIKLPELAMQSFIPVPITESEVYMAIIHIVDSRAEADYSVYEVDSRADADLLVCKVNSRGEAVHDDQYWCFVDNRADASANIKFIDTRANADLLVCYVDSRGEAGWRNEHPLYGKLSN